MKQKLLVRLLNAIGRAADGLANFITALSLAACLHFTALEGVCTWFGMSPDEQQQIEEQLPQLSAEQLTLLAEFQRLMDAQYQLGVLQRYALTLPALPEEGY
ncbi:MAG: hypothetical protein QOJ86_2277 [Bradyrhizobium sp.]|jgi:predicted Fe-S protein YdhL (DUF1289 family)|nr:hypothetical protein [Bradyrhizobium sp.]